MRICARSSSQRSYIEPKKSPVVPILWHNGKRPYIKGDGSAHVAADQSEAAYLIHCRLGHCGAASLYPWSSGGRGVNGRRRNGAAMASSKPSKTS